MIVPTSKSTVRSTSSPKALVQDRPPGGEPASSGLHTHAKLRQAGRVCRSLRRPESTRELGQRNSGCVILNSDYALIPDQYPNCQRVRANGRERLAVGAKALHGIINELGDSEPLFVVEVLQNAKNAYTR